MIGRCTLINKLIQMYWQTSTYPLLPTTNYNDIDEHDVKFLRGLQGPSSFWHRLDIQGIWEGEGDQEYGENAD